ncbi:MAG: sulfatase-like hydrolase/transferase [Betaproteobacteria bacterium]|nr:sulfatase-like hydrolase/transferase [Betaproteobacteria bacterium]
MMDPRNLLILMSDEHNPKVMGCAGNEIIRTPNLDALAREGTRFTSAYTTCPICVPARASFAVGKYVHQIGYWDNADAYDGAIPSWHHRLRDRGHEVVSIGKLHFRGAPGDDHGFTTEIVPMHVIDGIGDVKGLVRENIPRRRGGDKMARLAGPGESPYTVYDRDIAARAQIWLHEAAKRVHDKPWVLFVSFVAPHFPLTAPPEWYYQYADRDLPLPKQYGHDVRPHHPFLDDYARVVDYDRHFRDRDDIQRALAGYYGLVSATDEHIGHVLAALRQSGLEGATRVLYTSDHGDNLGARGLWGKSTFFEESAGVPLILAGDGIPAGIERATPVSLVDVYPFVFECVGATAPDDRELPGISLAALAAGQVPDRAVVSEYHATTSVAGAYMLREGDFKYVHYVAYPAQLYDLQRDPEELHDVAGEPAYAETLARLRRRLLEILDPDEVDARAKRRQAELLERHGGRDVALARGDLGFTPAPGTEPEID